MLNQSNQSNALALSINTDMENVKHKKMLF